MRGKTPHHGSDYFSFQLYSIANDENEYKTIFISFVLN